VITPSRWWDRQAHADRRPLLVTRGRIREAVRRYFADEGFTEVECGALQVSPGNETHLHAFETSLTGPDGATEFWAYGWWGVLAFALALAILQMGLIPLSIFAVAGGMIFGWEKAFIAVQIGTNLGASINFLIARYVARNVELYGKTVPAGSAMMCLSGSANRDDRRFPDPDRFDAGRTNIAHLTFGAGPHVCLGMHLARMESAVAINALLDRLPDLRLDSTAPPPTVTGVAFRSPTTLPVEFTPA